MIAHKDNLTALIELAPKKLRSALAGTSPSRPGNGAAARSTMTPLALIQGFLKRSHSAQRRQIIPLLKFKGPKKEVFREKSRVSTVTLVIRLRIYFSIAHTLFAV
jgi:hypothetical protein